MTLYGSLSKMFSLQGSYHEAKGVGVEDLLESDKATTCQSGSGESQEVVMTLGILKLVEERGMIQKPDLCS